MGDILPLAQYEYGRSDSETGKINGLTLTVGLNF